VCPEPAGPPHLQNSKGIPLCSTVPKTQLLQAGRFRCSPTMSPGPTTASSTCCSTVLARGVCKPCLGEASSAAAAASGEPSALAAPAPPPAASAAASTACCVMCAGAAAPLTRPTICTPGAAQHSTESMSVFAEPWCFSRCWLQVCTGTCKRQARAASLLVCKECIAFAAPLSQRTDSTAVWHSLCSCPLG
jgi:hypothetical protein